ncbi:GntR family transcriptional regulator [Actinospica durhamensis]|uniref:GntR family transcriptional regulator n=1 Tax=Actinospica durhamensis TaxID=1508375 RepID=A0A941EQ38_9ACTN|nr:GntR family transcriptional regulator [Actinospica durhamensis]MBR7835073.1 GntR family transcriptional regulator [Actinospica durhamensis]
MADSGARQAKTSRAVNELIAALSATYKPGELLPGIRSLMEQFSAGQHVVRTALQQMRDDGMIITEIGVGSRLCNTAPAHLLTRTPEDPFAHLRPIAPAQPSRGEANAVVAELFDVRKGSNLLTLRQAAEYISTRARAHTVRIIPSAAIYDLETRPDPYGERDKIIDAFTAHYGRLETAQRTRTIPAPTPDIRQELGIKPGTTVNAVAIGTRTIRSGRLLMTETEYTVADPTIEWETVWRY